MEFNNYTPFPALAFEGYDKQDSPFHVVVLRVTYDIVPLPCNASSPADATTATHQLILADRQAPLCMADEMHVSSMHGSVKYESDLAPFKPRCDVIVLAHAYSPTGRPQRSFNVSVNVSTHAVPRQAPVPPLPPNPAMSLSAEQVREHKVKCAWAAAHPIPGQVLVQKSLRITGERFFTRSFVLKRVIAWLLRIGTLGLVSLKTWVLTTPRPFVYLPIRYEYSFGGQCRIESTDRALRRVPKTKRLRTRTAQATS